jgi:O-antigen/teichoic acid export membrane protein
MSSAAKTGRAMFWRAIQLGGDKVVNLARLLILARLLAPGDFGLLALSAIAVDITLRLTDTGMTPALVQRAEVRREYYDVAWTVQSLRALLVGLGLLALAPLIAVGFGEPRATALIRLLACRVMVQGLLSIRLADLHRQLRFGALAAVYLGEVVVGAVLTIALAPTLGVLALAVGPLAAAAIQVILSFVVAPYRPRFATDSEAMRILLGFGKWIFAEGIVAVIGASLVQLVIARRLGVDELGLYYLATRLAFLPSVISSELVGVVVFPIFARLQGDAAAAGEAMRVTLLSLAVVVLPMALFLSILAEPITAHLLGARWDGTAEVIRVLSLVSIAGLFGDVMVPMFKGLGRPRDAVIMGIAQYVLLCVLAWTLIGLFGIAGAALTWLVAVSLAQLVGYVRMRTLVPRPFKGTAHGVLGLTVASGLGAFVALGISAQWPHRTGLLLGSLIGGTFTLVLMGGIDRNLKLGVADNLRSALPKRTL